MHPEQDAARGAGGRDTPPARAAAVRHRDRRPARADGQRLRGKTDGPAYDAAREAWSEAWGADVLMAGSGGSIPIVSALARRMPDAEALLVGTTDGYANIHGPNERVLLSEFEQALRRRGGLLRPLAEAYEDRRWQPAPPRPSRPSRPRASGFTGGCSTWIERVGNKVPHPAILFLALSVGVILLSQILYLADVNVTYDVVQPPPAAVRGDYVGGSALPAYQLPAEPAPADATTWSRRDDPRSRAC